MLAARSGTALQVLVGAHPRQQHVKPGGATLTAGVTTLVDLPGGALSAGADGTVKLWRRSAG